MIHKVGRYGPWIVPKGWPIEWADGAGACPARSLGRRPAYPKADIDPSRWQGYYDYDKEPRPSSVTHHAT